jgi:hypothetical protein
MDDEGTSMLNTHRLIFGFAPTKDLRHNVRGQRLLRTLQLNEQITTIRCTTIVRRMLMTSILRSGAYLNRTMGFKLNAIYQNSARYFQVFIT